MMNKNMRNSIVPFLLVLAMLATVGGNAFAQDYVVVVAEGSTLADLTADDVKMIYLGKKTFHGADKVLIEPVMVESESPAGTAFLEKVVGQKANKYKSYWRKRVFSGSGSPPKTYENPAEAADSIRFAKGGIAVVDAATSLPAGLVKLAF